MTSLSSSEFILAQMPAGSPRRARSASPAMSSSSVLRRVKGAIERRSRPSGRAYPVMKLNARAASRASAGRT